MDLTGRRIVITVKPLGDGARIFIDVPDGEPLMAEWVLAAEFLVNLAASRSKAGFERAVELIANGAMTHKLVKRQAEDG